MYCTMLKDMKLVQKPSNAVLMLQIDLSVVYTRTYVYTSTILKHSQSVLKQKDNIIIKH